MLNGTYPTQQSSSLTSNSVQFALPPGLIVTDSKVQLWLYKNEVKLSETLSYTTPTVTANSITFPLLETAYPNTDVFELKHFEPNTI